MCVCVCLHMYLYITYINQTKHTERLFSTDSRERWYALERMGEETAL